MGNEGNLHECSIYANDEAGVRLRNMLSVGQSEPWPDALEKITGQRTPSGKSLLNYYAT